MKRKRLWGNLLALAFGLFIALGGAELYLRLTANSTNNYGTTLRYAANSSVGYTLEPNQDAVVNLPCTRIGHVRVNSLGFRDHEWEADGKPKVAVLGDSFMEGVHMNDSDNVSGILEQLLGVEVMNFGVSGYGTVANLFVYRNYVRKFHPKVVLLFFFTQNDFLNDHCALDVRTGNFRAYPCPCGTLEEGKVTYHTTHPPGISPELPPQPTGFHLYDYLSSKLRKPSSQPSTIWPQYLPPWKGEYADARDITTKALADLQSEVQADGGKLIVVTVPPYLDMLGDQYAQEVKDVTRWDSVPAQWDSRYPLRVLDTIASGLNLPLLTMEHVFESYLQEHHPPYPLLSYPCDGHLNPAGHFILAHRTAPLILAMDSLGKDSSSVVALQQLAMERLRLSPREILGEQGYRQIYDHGPFAGKTEIILRMQGK